MQNAGKIWKILPQKSDDFITQLLINRGLEKKEEIDKFFNSSLKDYEKELDIPNIKKAQDRISDAIKKQELIIVYGDYDVDGITASAILYKALSSLGAKVLPYIPHREKEGYGLSKLGLEFARDSGASVVITVDNGIVAIEQAEFAKELGLDLIITDHHIPLDKKPNAYTIVHSTQMCGAAVAWCLIQDLVSEALRTSLLEFVAIATVADMLPLLGLGRAFVVEGLKELKNTKNLGLLSLSKDAGIDISQIGSYEIGHIIAPRLNAIGRLEHAIDALRLLCTKDPIKAKNLSKLLSDTNVRRQILTEQAADQARLLIKKNGFKKIHILHSKNWAPGIIGLIAARVTEEYYTPAIALSVGATHSKGSARSIQGINIVEVIRKCSDILVDVGGHKGAAGFTIANEYIEEFKVRIEKFMDSLPVSEEQFLETSEAPLQVEAEVESKNLTKPLAKEIEKFAPFGMGNPRPLLATKGMEVSDIRTLKDGKHLKFKVEDTERSRSAQPIDCIAFNMGHLKDLLKPGRLVDLAFYLEINKFNGKETLQLKVKDLKIN